ncbi:MAG TPA: hypothetical protein VG325_04955 [Solirubrobacteraceae bacterium]|jgi:hypothetical protein|nr:hypothetical protein [Solirubrobacteraceae bacterium]
MADWVTISSLATAGGTLVLAVATFSSVRSANRSARIAEQSLLVGLRPVLIPSREEDPVERIRFRDGVFVSVPGHGAAVMADKDTVYLAIGVRNGGSGLAVLHGWRPRLREESDEVPDVEEFRRQQLDIYIPAGDTGFWQGALRDPSEAGYAEVREALDAAEPIQVDLLYGDHEGGQRTIARLILSAWPDDGEPIPNTQRTTLLRYFNVDRQNPRYPR